ncbi:hypothetical protein EB796_022391 [Bugula neritina]|uniref:Coronin n=1 Tax=Bugula neritina TaxID=10212 RepID=A0A7J7IZH5_BUGNE|nr:hypothetical protein EB796_022391 [Bugula neritina]
MAAWRQKQWKYKNTTPKILKKEECITGLSASRLMQTAGNYIRASSKYMVFNIDGHGGGCLGVLPLSTTGHISSNLPLIYAHGNFVSDFGFSPHDDSLLATTSFDNHIKLWRLPDVPVLTAPSAPESEFPELPRRGDALSWNPLVSSLMYVVAGNLLRLYDVRTTTKMFEFDDQEEVIQGACWSLDGSHIVTSSKDLLVRLFDPRANSSAALQSCPGHEVVNDSRIIYVNDNRIITTGFCTDRSRRAMIYDTRNLSGALDNVDFDSSHGILVPLFDQDTNMLYAYGRGDNNVRFMESTSKPPYLVQAACDLLKAQVKGACLVPKTAVDVMKGEVNRLLVLSKDSVVPVPYIIPRRSYAEFHSDVFPDTYSGEPGCDVDAWLTGAAPQIVKVSLDPAKSGKKSDPVEAKAIKVEAQPVAHKTAVSNSNGTSGDAPTPAKPVEFKPKAVAKVAKPVVATSNVSPVSQVEKEDHSTQTTPVKHREPSTQDASARQSQLFKSTETQTIKPLVWPHLCRRHPVSVKTSKFRHLKGTPLHKSHRIENIRNLSNRVPGESNGFAANPERCAITLKGPAGLVSVLELENVGKLEDTPLPALSHGVPVCDFKWDPFNNSRLATGTESGAVFLWEIPEGGLEGVVEEPVKKILAHNDKIYSLEFHPLASDVLASSAQDFQVKIWDLQTETSLTLEGHSSPILAMAWSSNGIYLATYSKDSIIRIYEPRASTSPIREGKGPSGGRSGRIVWVLNDSFVAVSGFDRNSERCLQLFDPEDLSVGVASVELNNAPSLLIPYYDADSHTIFLTAKGDTIVQAYEVTSDAPYFQVLSSFHASSQHQALAFLPKKCCDVANIEFAKAYRLTLTMIEPISFTVPRVRSEFFQDDLFPDTSVTWEASSTSSEWFSGIDKQAKVLSLFPEGMTKLSEAPPEKVKERKYEKFDAATYKTAAQKRDELGHMQSPATDSMDMCISCCISTDIKTLTHPLLPSW